MEHINGQNNTFTITLPNKTIDCLSSDDEKYRKLIDRGNIINCINKYLANPIN